MTHNYKKRIFSSNIVNALSKINDFFFCTDDAVCMGTEGCVQVTMKINMMIILHTVDASHSRRGQTLVMGTNHCTRVYGRQARHTHSYPLGSCYHWLRLDGV